MALTISTPAHVFVVGDRKEVHVDVTFDSSYPTGGESLTAADLDLALELTGVEPMGPALKSDGTECVPVAFDHANSKLLAFRYDGASAGKAFLEEVTNAVDLSAFTVRLRCVGKGDSTA